MAEARPTISRTQVQNMLVGLVSWKGNVLTRSFDGPPTIKDIQKNLRDGSYTIYGDVQDDLQRIIAGNGDAEDGLRGEVRAQLTRLEEKLGVGRPTSIVQPVRIHRVMPSGKKRRRAPRVSLPPRRHTPKPPVRTFQVGQEVEVSPPEEGGRRMPDAISAVVTGIQGDQISIRFSDELYWQRQSAPTVFGIADVVSKPPVTPEGFPTVLTQGDRIQFFINGGWYDVCFRALCGDGSIEVCSHPSSRALRASVSCAPKLSRARALVLRMLPSCPCSRALMNAHSCAPRALVCAVRSANIAV